MKTPDSTMVLLARLQHLAVEVSNTTEHDVTMSYNAGNSLFVNYYEGGFGVKTKDGWTRTSPQHTLIGFVAIDRADFEEIAMEAICKLQGLLDRAT